MLWLARPPYLRWLGAALLVSAALVAELAPRPTVPHPFALVDLAAGSEVDDADVEWRQVPVGLLPTVELPLRLRAPLAAGEPLLPSAAGTGPAVPEGWWAIELGVPAAAEPGREVRVVVTPAGLDQAPVDVPGVVVGSAPGDGYGPPPALVAVPGESAALVAAAAAEGRVSVLVGAS